MNQAIHQVHSGITQDESIDLARHVAFLRDNRWLIVTVALAVMLAGVAYAFLARPVYEADLLVQVEGGPGMPIHVPGDVPAPAESKAGAASEVEILRSRLVVARAVDDTRLYIHARPKTLPLIGAAIARHNRRLSAPGLFGYGGYVWGAERMTVSRFDVPDILQEKDFTLQAGEHGGFTLRLADDAAEIDLVGRVGETLEAMTPQGGIALRIDSIDARPGAEFLLTRKPRDETVEKLQDALRIMEKGKQSGIIGVSLQGHDAQQTSMVLNRIGNAYIQQNEERKAREAEKSLAFLNRQLPELKQEVERAETAYNAMRHRRGTVDLGEEARTLLQQSAASQAKLLELRQHKEELLIRYQEEHPYVQTVNQQMQVLNRELGSVDERIRRLPAVEQEVLRLTREVKVNTDVYTAVLSTAQQLRLLTASKAGNARLLDTPVLPVRPVKPKRLMVIAVASLLGLALGIAAALGRKMLHGVIDNPGDIRHRLGLHVVATIPYSQNQQRIHARMQDNNGVVSVLAHRAPSDIAVESLRRIRAALHGEMRHAGNNVILITSPTPEVGKSFVAVNFAALLAAAGKKVLLIDADLRRGYLHRYFGIDSHSGLSELIARDAGDAGDEAVWRAIHRTDVENVDFLSTGKHRRKPAELLAHENFSRLLGCLSARYDFVLLDTAPVLAVADALMVSPHAGALFSVVRGGVNTGAEIEEMVKRLNQAGARVSGMIFNDLRPSSARYDYAARYPAYRYDEACA
jgi:tyrosine-protein kinase Etk/Wzc